MAETLIPEQRARSIAYDAALGLDADTSFVLMQDIATAIRAAETAAVAAERERCVEFVRGYNAWKRVPDTPDQPPTEIADALQEFSSRSERQ